MTISGNGADRSACCRSLIGTIVASSSDILPILSSASRLIDVSQDKIHRSYFTSYFLWSALLFDLRLRQISGKSYVSVNISQTNVMRSSYYFYKTTATRVGFSTLQPDLNYYNCLFSRTFVQTPMYRKCATLTSEWRYVHFLVKSIAISMVFLWQIIIPIYAFGNCEKN